ncbi:signal peptidase I [Massilia eurypsychrophila]|jgi:signal peptidase I|uniref:Signal peptidase I n=1 Tax=Massilia eurypsychrophila TaxID=1485217 RepID=A0A2G8TIM3_9BURK|nr:signal peptidase I [Massilia eurypsychrophila]PIL45894.1 signal peptidase I [Massilia eurypsychrophila]
MQRFIRANKGFLMFLFLFGIFRTAVADWNPIPSGSMRPNLLEGDVVLVNRLAFDLKVPLTDIIVTHLGDPQRGDVVTFSSPTDGTRLIKRVIALPGDVVAMRDEQLTINGQPATYSQPIEATEPLAGSVVRALQLTETVGGVQRRIQVMPQVAAMRNFAARTIPPGEYLMLGDNRDNSADSRVIGLVPRALLIGRAERVLVSADMLGNWMPRTERFGMSLAR